MAVVAAIVALTAVEAVQTGAGCDRPPECRDFLRQQSSITSRGSLKGRRRPTRHLRSFAKVCKPAVEDLDPRRKPDSAPFGERLSIFADISLPNLVPLAALARPSTPGTARIAKQLTRQVFPSLDRVHFPPLTTMPSRPPRTKTRWMRRSLVPVGGVRDPSNRWGSRAWASMSRK